MYPYYVPNNGTAVPWNIFQPHGNHYWPKPVRAGWQCPSCGAGMSPEAMRCPCKPVAAPADATQCTCPRIWMSVTAPPPCPVHGQIQMFRVTCTPTVNYC